MKRIFLMNIFVLITAFTSGTAQAQDMRVDQLEAEKLKQVMVQKADAEKKAAQNDAQMLQKNNFSDRNAILEAISKLKTENQNLNDDIRQLDENIKKLNDAQIKLKDELAENEAINNELSGVIKTNIKDLETLFGQSLQSAFFKDRTAFLKNMLKSQQIPSMKEIKKLADQLLDEIQKSGEVRQFSHKIVDRKGQETEAEILVLGNFTALYNLPHETGFLLYSDKSQRLFALSKLPKTRVAKKNIAYMTGQSEDVYLDISKGGAIRQLTHELDLMDQIPKGGPIVWPILLILCLAILIVFERIVFIFRKQMNANAFMLKISGYVLNGDWEACIEHLEKNKHKAIPKIILKAIPFRNQTREDMENVLQEAILGEIPQMERFLSTLGMLAAIAPLLGLLGTVTGMMNTFNVITYYGTGDPRMMSGGILEALVTTMLGLSVAIPIMLAHTLLSRKVENEIGQMEEKAVSFVNMVFKVRGKEG